MRQYQLGRAPACQYGSTCAQERKEKRRELQEDRLCPTEGGAGVLLALPVKGLNLNGRSQQQVAEAVMEKLGQKKWNNEIQVILFRQGSNDVPFVE